MASNLISNRNSEMDDITLYQHIFGKGYGAYMYKQVMSRPSDLSAYINTFVVREMWTRPGLDLKTKLLVAIGMFLALHREEVKFFVVGALVQGATKQEIEEIIILLAAEAGFPAALHTSTWVKEAFEEYEKFEKNPS